MNLSQPYMFPSPSTTKGCMHKVATWMLGTLRLSPRVLLSPLARWLKPAGSLVPLPPALFGWGGTVEESYRLGRTRTIRRWRKEGGHKKRRDVEETAQRRGLSVLSFNARTAVVS